MIVNAKSSAQTVLLVLPATKQMYPLSTDALTRAQASRKQLSTDYQEALIIDGDGSVRKFEEVEVVGPLGDSIGRKLLSRLTDAWQINVRLSDPLPHTLEEIKRLVLDCAAMPGVEESMQWESEQLQGVIASLQAASSVQQLVQLLKLPAPKDALDVL